MAACSRASANTSNWPVMARYSGARLRRVALPLGGIGTGTVSLGGRGDLRDWEIVNHTAKGFTPKPAFFVLHARRAGRPDFTRVLEGPIDNADLYGRAGSAIPCAGLPRFARAECEATYPFARVKLEDPATPLRVALEAFNPLVPGDAEASGWPVAVLRFVLTNPGPDAVRATVAGTLKNFIGTDGTDGAPSRNRNTFRKTGGVRGIFFDSEGVPADAEQWGTMALAVSGAGRVSHRTSWADRGWNQDLLDFWDDLAADGRLDPGKGGGGGDAPVASLATELVIPARATRSVTFLLCWHFPNRLAWTWKERDPALPRPYVGNHYTRRHADAWVVATAAARDLPALERRTRAFLGAFCAADLPAEAKEAALFNLSTLRTQTCFRIADGRFFGWEGGHNLKAQSSTHGSCTHVWGYEQTLARTFPDLAWSMRETNFRHMTDEAGAIRFRTALPPEKGVEWACAAADGQMACLLALHREWQLTGDEEKLRAHWPAARRALEFCWRPGSWDADQDGVMEGCQHNTMDVEYYGPNIQMTGWYLAALRAMAQMSRHLADEVFAARCDTLFARGRAWVEKNLFNGACYEQRLPKRIPDDIEPATRLSPPPDPGNPAYQLGKSCLVDQLIGALAARFAGLGDILDAGQVRKTLRTIKRHNFRRSFRDHVNAMRTYAAGDEAGTVMASYPDGDRPASPFPYFSEAMPAFEYAAAIHMLYAGMEKDGLELIRAVRARHDGERRNPFDECEWGHHYSRSMIAWGALLALTGFHYHAAEGRLEFRAVEKPTRWFWSSGAAWGTIALRPTRGAIVCSITCLHGRLRLRRLVLAGFGECVPSKPTTLRAGRPFEASVARC